MDGSYLFSFLQGFLDYFQRHLVMLLELIENLS